MNENGPPPLSRVYVKGDSQSLQHLFRKDRGLWRSGEAKR